MEDGTGKEDALQESMEAVEISEKDSLPKLDALQKHIDFLSVKLVDSVPPRMSVE